MTPTQQAALEQVAREWLLKNGYCLNHSPDGETKPYRGELDSLVALLAAQRAAGLEAGAELIDKRLTHYHTTKGVNAFTRAIQINEAEGCAETIRKLAQEQRP